MHILIAPDAFKGTLTATEAARAIESGLSHVLPDAKFSLMPMADGGEGSAEVLRKTLAGVEVNAQVNDPLMRPIEAHYALLDHANVAVIELAQASGLAHLSKHELHPLQTSSYGTGELVLHALGQGIKKLWICLGGSATVDGGLGFICALGAVGFDAQGDEVAPNGQGLIDLQSIDLSNLDPRLKHTEITVLCDVDNALTGPHGARMFMPQKGADHAVMDQLDAALARWSELLYQRTGRAVSQVPGAGAAGGLGAGLAGALGANLVSGAEFILDRVGFADALKNTDWVITGEGRFDAQTAHGKVIAGVAHRAREQSVPTIVVCGSKAESIDHLEELGIDAIFSITPDLTDEGDAIRRANYWLRKVAYRAGEFIQLGQSEG